MSWIKNALVDMAVTAVMAVFAFTGAAWSWWIIAIYTPLMVVLKLFALSGAAAVVKQKPDEVPVWMYHVLYGANLVFLLVGAFYLAAAGWALIWVLSVVAEAKRRPSRNRTS